MTKVSAAEYDIRDYGARCDGTDDGPAVQSLLSSLADGSHVVVGCRAYIGAGGLRLSRKNDVVIEGADGGGFFALSGNPERILVGLEYCDRCILRNLMVDSQNLPVAGLSINYSADAKIEGNTVVSVAYPASAAILGLGNRRNTYSWNTVRTTGVYMLDGAVADGVRGIWLGNPRPDWIEYDPVISNNFMFDLGASAIAVNGAGATVTGNYVDGTKGSGVKISLPPGQGRKTIIQSNRLRNNLFSGVQIEAADTPTIIDGNVLEQNQIAGVYVSGGGFAEGEICANRIAGSGEAGIYMYDANGALIEGNDINGGGKAGIVFESRSGAIQNVRLNANTVSGVLGHGVIMLGRGGAIRGVTLASNEFSYIRQYGLAIEEQNSGAITSPSLIANCFSNIGAGTLLDTRPQGALTPPATAASCSRPPQSRFRAIRINAGGPQFVDAKRTIWEADTDLVEGNVFTTAAAIAGTDTPELYRTGRWNPGKLEFSVNVPNRVYTVTLKFAESVFSARGARVFDIYVNGQLVAPAFDVLAYAKPLEALDRSFRVIVDDGKLSVRMVAKVDAPMICAIEIQ